MSNVKISVIVPCYNEEKTIGLLLDALEHQTFPPDETEIIFADGMSTDQTTANIQRWKEQRPHLAVKIVTNEKRIIPAGLNRAIAAATGEYIVRLDAHSVPAADYLTRCYEALNAGKGENVGGRWDIRPGDDSVMAKSIAAAAASPFGVGDAKYRYSESAGYVDTVPFGSYRRETLEKLGGYDETLLSNEDYDLNTRIRLQGGAIWFDPKIRCVYFARKTLSALAAQYWRYGYWKTRMLKKYPSSLRPRQFIPPVFVLSLIALLIGQFFWKPLLTMLLLEVGVYIAALSIVAIRVVGGDEDLRMLIGIPAAIVTMHFCWGCGFLWSLLKLLGDKDKGAEKAS